MERIEARMLFEAIHQRYGYDFRNYAPDSLERRLRTAMLRLGASNVRELMERTLTDSSVFRNLLTHLTVQVTEMFRDPTFYAAFRREVVPILRTYPELKVWHAGCATGEEVYATAIVLMEEDLYERSQLYGTDIDQTAIERAREGIYDDSRLAEFAESHRLAGGKRLLSDYVTQRYGHFSIAQKLRSNVVFFQHDLTCDYSLGEMTVIFFRNVGIYFNDVLRGRVYSMLQAGLRPGGFLCLGASETVPHPLRGTMTEFVARERIWRN
jgi:chemotaxis protein methyltransferase CheR